MKELPDKRVDASIAWYRRFLVWVEHRWRDRSPGTHKLFRTFQTGVGGLVTDFQDFVTVWTRVSGGGAPYSHLGYREISLLRLVPKELVRATPALCISALPGTVLFLPVLFYFPRLFLTEHFWTPEQRLEFSSAQLRRRQSEYRHLIDDLAFLQPQLNSAALRILLHNIHLSRASGISAFRLYREYRLWRLAKLLYEEDRAVERANFVFADPTKPSDPAAERLLRQQFCLARGYQSWNRPDSEADKFVRQWCRLSAGLRDTNNERRLAFMLHLPSLMASVEFEDSQKSVDKNNERQK
uniref:LETM1 domain-containing protein n=1 Tax=Macrostomum lignano TaxID=282301 RepID=A0A1I8H879_9PLAT